MGRRLTMQPRSLCSGACPCDFCCPLAVASCPPSPCAVRVLFEPDRRGAAAASLLIGDDYASVPVAVSGTGASLHLAAASALDVGPVAVGMSAGASLLLTNDGLDPLALTGATVSAAGDLTGPQYAASLAGCPATLPVSATCALAVRFAPTTLGPHSQLLTIASSAGATIVQLGGRGVTTGLGLAPPTLTSAPPPFAGADARIAFTGTPGASFACSVDGSVAAACASPLVLSGLREGSHEVLVVERGASGEQSPPVAARWTVDTTAPGRAVVRSTRKGQMAVFTIAPAADGRLRCRVDRRPFADCGPRVTLRNLRPGAHAFEARLRDEAGNVGPVVRVAWRVVVATTVDSAGR